MADYINHISQDDLDIISGGLKKPGSDRKMAFFEDLVFGLAHLAFYPLVYITMVVDMTEVLGSPIVAPGFGSSSLIDVLSWSTMLIAGYLVFMMKTSGGVTGKEPGFLAHFGHVVFMVFYCIMTPFVMGIGILIFLLVAFGKIVFAFPVMFPMILFAGFSWIYVHDA